MIFTTLFTQPIYNLIMVLFNFTHDMGIAIILFSVLIRLLLWPLNAKMIHSQKTMQDLQPLINDIKEKAKGDKQKESQLLMELYKEKGVNPFSSCLPLLIQLPFLFAVFEVFKGLKIDAALLYAPVENLPLIKDLLLSGAFHPTLFGILDLTKIPVVKDGAKFILDYAGIVLALIMGATQFLQTKILQPNKPDTTQAMMGKFNLIFPVLLTYLSLVQFQAALTLYWTIYNMFMALQQYLILKGDLTILRQLPWKKKTQPKES